MESEVRKDKLTNSIFEQLPGGSIAKLVNVVEVYGFVIHKGERYALAKADVVFKVPIHNTVLLHEHNSVSLGSGRATAFTSTEAAEPWANLYTELFSKAIKAGQVFL